MPDSNLIEGLNLVFVRFSSVFVGKGVANVMRHICSKATAVYPSQSGIRIMPELPEVETSRAQVQNFVLNSTIVNCCAIEQGGGPRDGEFDNLVMDEEMTAEKLTSSLEGRKILALKRRGKQMWFVLDKPPHPLFHFGMTGSFSIKGQARHKYVKFNVDGGWPPKFTKLELEMSNGTCLALSDPRRLARVRLREDPEASPPISSLGPDPFTNPLSLEDFAASLAKPTAPIKAVLLDQERIVSGVGNWVADEVCFQACVHPGAKCNTLSPEQVAALHSKLLYVCREACEKRADYTVFPAHWLFHHRWGKGKGAEGAPHTASGHRVHFEVVGGRTTAIVSDVQRMGLLRADSSTGSTTPAAKTGKSKTRGGVRSRKGVKEEEGEANDKDMSKVVDSGASGPKKDRSGRRGKTPVRQKVEAKTEIETATTEETNPVDKKRRAKRTNSVAVVKSRAVKAKSASEKVPMKATPKPRQRMANRSKKAEVPAAAKTGRAKRSRAEGEKEAKDPKQDGVKRLRSATSSSIGNATIKRGRSKSSATGDVTTVTRRGATGRKKAGPSR